MIQLAPIVLSSLAMVFPNPQPVRCNAPPSWEVAGTVNQTDYSHRGVVILAPGICLAANKLGRDGAVDEDTVWGILVLAHEQEHLRMTWGSSESGVHRRAIRDVAPLVRVLLPHRNWYERRIADRRARRAERIARLISAGLPPEYQSARSR